MAAGQGGSSAPAPRKPYGTAASLDEAGEDVVLERVASGETMGAIAASYDVARRTLYRWIEAGGPERQAAFESARRLSADVAVEEAGRILDEAEGYTNAAQASIARARADHRRWLASVRDRDSYGDKPAGVAVNILNVTAGAHLDALRKVGSPQALEAAGRPTLPVVRAEVVEDRQPAPAVVDDDADVIAELLED